MGIGRPSEGAGRAGKTIDRRRFLRGAGAVGVGTALAGSFALPASAAPSDRRSTKKVTIYRLSTRGMDVCQACKGTGAHKYFRTRHVLRAHPGCNCRILTQPISQRTWNKYFVRKNGTLRKVFDDRG